MTTSTEQPATTESLSRSTTTHPSNVTSVPPFGVLVFHKTTGFRHDSIDAGIQALEEIAEAQGYEATVTQDSSLFTPDGLQPYNVVVFLNTTGDVLDTEQQEAMEGFIRAGNGFVGVHSAADTEYEWPWYGGLVGAYFDSHPEPQPAIIEIAAPEPHPVIAGLPAEFERFDEWYNFRTRPAADVTILAVLDESSYGGGSMGEPHPIVWAQEYDGGRAVYIGFGHTSESFSESLVRTVLANAIRWTAGRNIHEG